MENIDSISGFEQGVSRSIEETNGVTKRGDQSKQTTLFASNSDVLNLLTIKQASEWASQYLKKKVTPSNISYLVQYGRIKKMGSNGDVLVRKQDLIRYYDSYLGKREIKWKNQLGHDLNWELSFDNLKETDTTKYVHRLHPYKGKFIPQLVEYKPV